MLGRTFDGQGRPKKLTSDDTYPELFPEVVVLLVEHLSTLILVPIQLM